LFGVDRKWLAEGQNGAIDLNEKVRAVSKAAQVQEQALNKRTARFGRLLLFVPVRSLHSLLRMRRH
jgi:hypothetical protein